MSDAVPNARAPIAARPLGSTGLMVSELGFGAAPLGNLFRRYTDIEARATADAALTAGITLFDTAPYYGFGLSERRVGDAVRGHAGLVVSTKVGRLLKPLRTREPEADRGGFVSALPFEPAYDYGYDAVMRSWEASLQRLGLAQVDILLMHDLGEFEHGPQGEAMFAQATAHGGFRALEELRAGGAIKAFGLGVNECAVCLRAMQHVRLDVCLLAGRYTLLEQGALEVFMPACRQANVAVKYRRETTRA